MWLLFLEEQRVLLKVPYDSSLDGCLVVGCRVGLPRFFGWHQEMEEKGLEEGARIQIVDLEAKGV